MTRFTKTWTAGVALLAASALLSGCAGGADPEEGSGGSAGGLESLTLGVPGDPPILVDLMVQTAIEQGFFEDEGLDVDMRSFGTGIDVGRAVQSGEIEGGLMGTQGAIGIRASGGSVVGTLGLEHPTMLLASTDPAITSCEQAEGQTIAVDADGAPKDLALTAILDSCGLTRDQVSTIAVGGPTTVDALVAGQVKLAILHPDELAAVDSQVPAKSVVRLADVAPLNHYLLLVTTDETLASDEGRDRWVRIVRAEKKAIDFIADPANADAVAKSAASMTKRDLAVMQVAIGDFLDLGVWPVDSDGLSRESIEATIDAEVAAGNVTADKAPSFDELVDPSIYADAANG